MEFFMVVWEMKKTDGLFLYIEEGCPPMWDEPSSMHFLYGMSDF